MNETLKGWKTIIIGWITALAPVAAMIGYEINPEAVAALIDQLNELIAGAFLFAGAAIHYFRSLGKKREL